MGTVIVIVIGLVVVMVLLFGLVASMFKKVGPNQALIVYGFGGTTVVVGGGKIIWPMVQQSRELSLELMSFDVAPQQDQYTQQGVAVRVEAVSQIKVRSDEVSIKTAAEQFLNKTPEDREGLIKLVMEGHLRGIIGQLTVEQIVKDPEMVADRMRSNVAADMAKMGLDVISFTIKEVKDANEYIMNMGRPDVANIRRSADIAIAEADRDTTIRRAQASREAKIAEAVAEQEKVIAETASQTRQAEATRDLETKRAEYNQSVRIQEAQADKAYEIQTNIEQQRSVTELVKIDQVRKQGEIAVQEAEILRREKELIATVLKGAEVERQRIETLAKAAREEIVLEASGQAEAIRQEGQARADVTRLQGNADAEMTRVQGVADAEIILAKGNAEATAMQVRAAAFKEYNQAAVLDKFLSNMPEVVRALAEPLSKVDSITVVSTGGDGSNGTGTGLNRVTGDVSQMVAQVPALFEALTGMKIADLMAQVPQINAAMNGNGHHANGHGEMPDADVIQPPFKTRDASPGDAPAVVGAPTTAPNGDLAGKGTGAS